MLKLLLCGVCSLSMLGLVSTATAKGSFQIGPQVGYSMLDSAPSNAGVALGDFELNGASLGLVTRYTAPVGNEGIFVGLQGGLMREFSYEKGSFASTATASDGSTSPATATGKISTKWSADIMPRIGYRFGDVSLSLATGVSFIQGQVRAVGNVANTAVTASNDAQWHVGWKIAPGIDYKLRNNATLFSQVHYAKYQSENYTKSGASIKVKPEEYGVRVGVLFGF